MTGIVGQAGLLGPESAGAILSSSQSVSSVSNPMEVLSALAQGGSLGSGGGGSTVLISPFGQFVMALMQVQMENAAIFKQTAAEATARILQEAEQKANAESKQFLNGVANALQNASQTGDLSQLVSLPNSTIQAYSRTGQPVTPTAITSIPSDSISLSQLFSLLATQAKTLVRPTTQEGS